MAKLKAIRAFFLNRELMVQKDQVIDVEDDVALQILNCGKAEPADESTKSRFTQKSNVKWSVENQGRANWINNW